MSKLDYYYDWQDYYVRNPEEPDVPEIASRYDVRQKDIITSIKADGLEQKRYEYQKKSYEIANPDSVIDKNVVKEKHRKMGELFQSIIANEIKATFQSDPNDGPRILNLHILKGLDIAMKTMSTAIKIEADAIGLYEDEKIEDRGFDGEIEVVEINPQERKQNLARRFLEDNPDLSDSKKLEILQVILSTDEPSEAEETQLEIPEDEDE